MLLFFLYMLSFKNSFKNSFAISLVVISLFCGSEASADDVRQKRIGMTREEIIRVAGVPESVYKIDNKEYWGYVWNTNRSCRLTYIFENNKAVDRIANEDCK